MPSGWAADGVPTGVQVVGRTFDDDTVFHAGAALERAGFGYGGQARRRPALAAASATGGDSP